jgi:hypothetical protein
VQLFHTACIATLLIASLACQKQLQQPQLSREQQLLRSLYPAAFAQPVDLAKLPLRYVATSFTGQPTRWMVATWGVLPGSVPHQVAELALLEESAETFRLVARLPIIVGDWPGEGELVAVDLSSETHALSPTVGAFAVRLIRRLPELQPALYVESLALYQLRESTFNRLLYRTAGFHEEGASDPNAVRAVLTVEDKHTGAFANLVLRDNKGGSTTFRWNGIEYVPLVSSGQAQRVRLNSVSQVLGSGRALEASGRGSAIINGGGGYYMWNSSTPPDIRIALAAADAVTPSLCSRLVRTGIPAGKALELNGTGTFDNTGKPSHLSARFRLSTLSSCEWVKIQ